MFVEVQEKKNQYGYDLSSVAAAAMVPCSLGNYTRRQILLSPSRNLRKSATGEALPLPLTGALQLAVW